MKRVVLLSVLFGAMPLLSMAQDDLYFTPSKAEQTKYLKDRVEGDRPVYYSGIGKSNDEYNRRGQYSYKKVGVDSLGNDIFMSRISTLHGDSVVLDTIYGGLTRRYDSNNDDFAYSRRMSRFDGYWGGYYDPWFAGRSSIYVGWGFGSPFYGGWYDTWNDPWYYSYYGGYPYYSYYGGYPYYSYYGGYPYYGYAGYGWYNPWRGYYGYGWGYPYYGYRGVYVTYRNGHTGTANHWGTTAGDYNYNRNRTYSNYPRTYSGQNRNTTNTQPNDLRSYQDRFGGQRQSDFQNQTRQVYSMPENNSFGGASRGSFGGGFGGSQGGGASFGGARGGSGSVFGGHR